MSNPGQPPPSWWQQQVASIEKWGIAHWTYIVVAVVANVIGAVFHV